MPSDNKNAERDTTIEPIIGFMQVNVNPILLKMKITKACTMNTPKQLLEMNASVFANFSLVCFLNNTFPMIKIPLDIRRQGIDKKS